MKTIGLILLAIGLLLKSVPSFATSNTVHLGIYIGGGTHRKDFTALLKEFRAQHPNIKVSLSIGREQAYSDLFTEAIETKKGPDILLWFAGKRMEHLVKNGHIQDINSLWKKHNFDTFFSKSIVDSIKIDGKAYALPLTYYYFGLYTNIALFKSHNIDVPQDWGELLDACRKFRKKDIDMFALGSKTAWTTHGWFDYINLRLNGLEFHKDVLSGKVPFTHPKVKNTLAHWKQLLDLDCFTPNHKAYNRDDIYPRLLHNRAAMLMAGSIPPDIPKKSLRNIRLLPFPKISDIPAYTLSPVNAFVIPAYTKITPALEKLILFLASARFQVLFNLAIHQVPAHSNLDVDFPYFIKQSIETINQSPGGIQFFDRDSEIEFSSQTPEIFVQFLSNRDIEKTASKLEKLRLSVFVKRPVFKKAFHH